MVIRKGLIILVGLELLGATLNQEVQAYEANFPQFSPVDSQTSGTFSERSTPVPVQFSLPQQNLPMLGGITINPPLVPITGNPPVLNPLNGTPVAAAPEPNSFLAAGLGLILLGVWQSLSTWRKQRRQALS